MSITKNLRSKNCGKIQAIASIQEVQTRKFDTSESPGLMTPFFNSADVSKEAVLSIKYTRITSHEFWRFQSSFFKGIFAGESFFNFMLFVEGELL